MYKTFDEWSLVTKLKLLSVLTVMFAIILPLWVSPQVLAAGTAAGTVIGNQATATYQDESSNSYTSTSNLVTTTVQPVYSLTVTPDGVDQGVAQSQNATPGAIVYFPYTLTNTGNSAGTFNLTTALGAANGFNPVAGSVKVYWDKDGDGTVSVGDTLLGQDTNNNGVIDAGDALVSDKRFNVVAMRAQSPAVSCNFTNLRTRHRIAAAMKYDQIVKTNHRKIIT